MPESLTNRPRWVDPMKDKSTRLYERKPREDAKLSKITQLQRMVLLVLSKLEVDALGLTEIIDIISPVVEESFNGKELLTTCKQLWDVKLVTDITKWRHKSGGKAEPVSSKFKITAEGMEVVEKLLEIDKQLMGE